MEGERRMLRRSEWLTMVAAVAGCVATGVLSWVGANAVVRFAAAGVSLALLAALVGQATEQIGGRLGPAATGIFQSALGNLPELFVGIFALRAGLVEVVQASLVGSILGNSLLVLGLAFLVGGLRHGPQHFASAPPRTIATLTLLAVSALAVPTLVDGLHTPAKQHADALSVACAVVLLIVFAASILCALTGAPVVPPKPEAAAGGWSMALAVGVLAGAGIGAALVSDWFVTALRPAASALGLSHAFTGLVVVGLAGNAVENVVGVQMAARNQPDYAVSLILNSSLQVALALGPVLVLLSFVIGGAHLTLVLPGLLLAALALAGILGAFVVSDGESTWLEGIILIGLYGIIAAAFWWG
ncbi:MAG: sodium:proton exchanger [Thermomicrobiales bacterium]|nr:sodium:proton exchanger [Thermomicrobiales bacterium]